MSADLAGVDAGVPRRGSTRIPARRREPGLPGRGVTGVETVKAMAVEPQMQRRWEEQLAAYVGASFPASPPRQLGQPGRPV